MLIADNTRTAALGRYYQQQAQDEINRIIAWVIGVLTAATIGALSLVLFSAQATAQPGEIKIKSEMSKAEVKALHVIKPTIEKKEKRK